MTPWSAILSPFILVPAMLVAAAPAAAVTLTRGPYLQLLTTRSVTVVWNTDVPATCALAVRPLGGLPVIIEEPARTVCAIAVENLAPGAHYAYTPLADGAPLAPESVFRTDHPTLPYTFLVLGDSGSGRPAQFAVRDRMLESPADFILHTGDMVYDSGAAADFDPKFFGPYRDLLRQLVLWPCLGNHDIETAGGAAWRAAFYTPANNLAGSERYYSFDYGNAHVVVLDDTASLGPGSEQRTFLEQALDANTATWKLVVLHHTMYSSRSLRISARRKLVPLFDAHRVDIVFAGHDHDYERSRPLFGDRIVAPGAGTIYVTTGGGGHSIQPIGRSAFTAYSESAFHFTRVSVDGERLGLEMVRDDGVVRDAMSLVKGSPPSPARCGDDLVNQAEEECDGADHLACLGACDAGCTCAPVCGDWRRNQPSEVCDGREDAACPGLCLASCRCGRPSQFADLTPAADTYIEAETEARSDHGAAPHLDVDLRPFGVAYLKFDLGRVTAPVRAAALRLRCSSSSDDGGTVYPVADSGWIEGSGDGTDHRSPGGSGLKWIDVDANGNAVIDASDPSPYVPDFTRPLAALGRVNAGQTIVANVSAAFQGGSGLQTLAITNTSSDGATYASRDHAIVAYRPRLRLELAACGDGIRDAREDCDGADDGACPGACAAACSCPDVMPVADTYIEAGTEADRDHGAAGHLDVDLRPAGVSYLKFDLSMLSVPVTSATLTLDCTNSSRDGGTIYPVADSSWLEGDGNGTGQGSIDGPGLKWIDVDTNGDGAVDARDTSRHVPDFTRPLAVLGRVASGQAYSVDVSSALAAGPGVYTLVIVNGTSDGATYASREHPIAARRPRLHLTFGRAEPTG